MDQFKDIRGFAAYASRLRVGWIDALAAWFLVAYDESIGYLVGKTLGPKRVREEACDPDVRAKWLSGNMAT